MLNNLGRKLLRDGSSNTRLRVNLISMSIGFLLIFAGVICILLKSLTEQWGGPERFFLIPVSAMLSFCGILTFVITGVRSTAFLFRCQEKTARYGCLSVCFSCAAMVLSYAAVLAFLIAGNSGRETLPVAVICAAAAVSSAAAAAALHARAVRARRPDAGEGGENP